MEFLGVIEGGLSVFVSVLGFDGVVVVCYSEFFVVLFFVFVGFGVGIW